MLLNVTKAKVKPTTGINQATNNQPTSEFLSHPPTCFQTTVSSFPFPVSPPPKTMESNDDDDNNEIAYEFLPYLRAYKGGRVERFFGIDRVPTSTNPNSTVSSKDVVVSLESAVSARLFKPTTVGPNRRLPVLVYFHGGAYCFGSPFCAEYHNHLTSLVAEANVIAISVDYRLAPEYPIPIAYEDSWAALKWVASHCNGQGPENWINDNADLQRVFVAGDSAGANIAHNTAMKAGEEELVGLELIGACLVHPDFASKEGHVPKAWFFACPDTSGPSDPRINPAVDSRLGKMRCRRVLVCVAEKDWAKERGLFYYEALRKSEWTGTAEIVETEGEGHVFHLFNPNCENAVNLVKRLAHFINQE